MHRRDFLQTGAVVTAGVVASSTLPQSLAIAEQAVTTQAIPKRKLGRTNEELSIIGLGGVVVMNNSPSFASKMVAETEDRGINYFDVAPTYDNAQERLGRHSNPIARSVSWPARRRTGPEMDLRNYWRNPYVCCGPTTSIFTNFMHFRKCPT